MEWKNVHTRNIDFLTIYVFDSTPSTNSPWIFNYSQIFSIRVVTPDSQASIINFVVQISWGRYDVLLVACGGLGEVWYSHGKAWWSSGHWSLWSVSLPLDLGFESRPEASPCRAISGAADRSVKHCTNKWIKHYRVRVAALCVRTDNVCLPFWYLAAEGEECSKNILLYTVYTIQ